jgi:hypothetical protein
MSQMTAFGVTNSKKNENMCPQAQIRRIFLIHDPFRPNTLPPAPSKHPARAQAKHKTLSPALQSRRRTKKSIPASIAGVSVYKKGRLHHT